MANQAAIQHLQNRTGRRKEGKKKKVKKENSNLLIGYSKCINSEGVIIKLKLNAF